MISLETVGWSEAPQMVSSPLASPPAQTASASTPQTCADHYTSHGLALKMCTAYQCKSLTWQPATLPTALCVLRMPATTTTFPLVFR